MSPYDSAGHLAILVLLSLSQLACDAGNQILCKNAHVPQKGVFCVHRLAHKWSVLRDVIGRSKAYSLAK
jgi:hypothetical protein